MNIYIHTLNGRPAGFDGERVCYAWRKMPVATSLKQIREEQRISAEWYGEPTDVYGYILASVSEQNK